MGSGLKAYNEYQEDQQAEKDRLWLNEKAKQVAAINPRSGEFSDFKWMEENREKIIRNKKLIDLLG